MNMKTTRRRRAGEPDDDASIQRKIIAFTASQMDEECVSYLQQYEEEEFKVCLWSGEEILAALEQVLLEYDRRGELEMGAEFLRVEKFRSVFFHLIALGNNVEPEEPSEAEAAVGVDDMESNRREQEPSVDDHEANNVPSEAEGKEEYSIALENLLSMGFRKRSVDRAVKRMPGAHIETIMEFLLAESDRQVVDGKEDDHPSPRKNRLGTTRKSREPPLSELSARGPPSNPLPSREPPLRQPPLSGPLLSPSGSRQSSLGVRHTIEPPLVDSSSKSLQRSPSGKPQEQMRKRKASAIAPPRNLGERYPHSLPDSEVIEMLRLRRHLTGERARDLWREKLLSTILLHCDHVQELESVWLDRAAAAVAGLENEVYESLNAISKKFHWKLRALFLNLKNNKKLSTRLVEGTLSPKDVVKFQPDELRASFSYLGRFSILSKKKIVMLEPTMAFIMQGGQ